MRLGKLRGPGGDVGLDAPRRQQRSHPRGRRAVGLDDAVRLQAVVRLEPPDRVIETARRGTPVTGLRRPEIAQRRERPFDRAQILGSALPAGLDPAAE